MDAEYPEHLLAREPAPPYDGEGPFAVWHFSEDPALGRFLPLSAKYIGRELHVFCPVCPNSEVPFAPYVIRELPALPPHDRAMPN